MIIANRLRDGLVVFFVAEGRWTTVIADGLLMADETLVAESLEAARRDEAGCLVIDPQPIEVEKADRPRPTAIREAIRAFGPTV